ncbi:MAG: hypothetical protein LBG58_14305 [Planctomycetaceae bacterium]|nr:hypothetical protein [Planctomycetaceae bacterium]
MTGSSLEQQSKPRKILRPPTKRADKQYKKENTCTGVTSLDMIKYLTAVISSVAQNLNNNQFLQETDYRFPFPYRYRSYYDSHEL